MYHQTAQNEYKREYQKMIGFNNPAFCVKRLPNDECQSLRIATAAVYDSSRSANKRAALFNDGCAITGSKIHNKQCSKSIRIWSIQAGKSSKDIGNGSSKAVPVDIVGQYTFQ
jgi:hypothetical protein